MQVYPSAYIDYLIEFHANRDYFECHELLEEYWKEHPESPYAKTWVGLIQTAVSLYHGRRGNTAGARKMNRQALVNLNEADLRYLGIDAGAFLDAVRKRGEKLEEDALPYADMNIPIADTQLELVCKELCKKRGLVWGQPSDMTNEELIHRHTRRDRSEVIRARQEQLELRKRKNHL